jgi:hypothetical protein
MERATLKLGRMWDYSSRKRTMKNRSQLCALAGIGTDVAVEYISYCETVLAPAHLNLQLMQRYWLPIRPM